MHKSGKQPWKGIISTNSCRHLSQRSNICYGFTLLLKTVNTAASGCGFAAEMATIPFSNINLGTVENQVIEKGREREREVGREGNMRLLLRWRHHS